MGHTNQKYSQQIMMLALENLNGFKANHTGIDANGRNGNITLELSALVRLEMNETIIKIMSHTSTGWKEVQADDIDCRW